MSDPQPQEVGEPGLAAANAINRSAEQPQEERVWTICPEHADRIKPLPGCEMVQVVPLSTLRQEQKRAERAEHEEWKLVKRAQTAEARVTALEEAADEFIREFDQQAYLGTRNPQHQRLREARSKLRTTLADTPSSTDG